jgi:ankyrin repeat protein
MDAHMFSTGSELRVLLSAPLLNLRSHEVMVIFIDSIYKRQSKKVIDILAMGYDLWSTDDAGQSPLFLAALWGSHEIFRIIRRRMGNSKEVNSQMNLAFHACAQHRTTRSDDHLRIMNDLLENGVNPNILDANNWTAMECATKAGDKRIQNELALITHSRNGSGEWYRRPSSWVVRSDNPACTVTGQRDGTEDIMLGRSRFQ